jgi:hypothetical protein
MLLGWLWLGFGNWFLLCRHAPSLAPSRNLWKFKLHHYRFRSWKRRNARAALSQAPIPCYHKSRTRPRGGNPQDIRSKEAYVADTKKIADKAERKKLKRTARKAAAPKAKRTTPRGSQKKKVKKMARGQTKR